MLEAMLNAKVGDDVKREDPTITELEKKLASMCGKEAGLFCTSGTLSNQLALRFYDKFNCRSHVTMLGDRDAIQHQIICDSSCHACSYC